mmetsp:Transcript_39661/g.78116  ORF Transcript_39661/g.78116 Transcript_39661/m.78116 type:complete len:87 (-) Transcript_39661:448-708(-)
MVVRQRTLTIPLPVSNTFSFPCGILSEDRASAVHCRLVADKTREEGMQTEEKRRERPVLHFSSPFLSSALFFISLSPDALPLSLAE